MSKPSVYLESSFISYLTNRRSRDILVAAHQEVTQQWWEMRRHDFQLFISDLVISEIAVGDPEASKRRLDAVNNIQLLTATDAVAHLTTRILEKKVIPAKAAVDAAHVAFAAIKGIDYLLTWNCKHIANMEISRILRNVIESEGYEAPLICTPLELLGNSADE
jgi:predicted nucleic acid-binding protein